MPVWLLRPRGRGDFIRQRAGGERRKLMCHSRWFLCFPSTWSQTGRREEMIYAHKGKRQGKRGRVRGRERKYHKRLPVREMSSFWWKCSCHDFCYGLKCWNCFQSEKLSCLSLRIGNGSISEQKHQQAQQCNAIFFPHYLHTVIQPIRRCPAALLRACFTIGAFFFLYSLLCNLEGIILWPASFINNCGSPINFLKSTSSWWQHIEYVGTQFVVRLLDCLQYYNCT